MSDNSKKTWLASTLPAAARTTIDTAMQLNGMSLPCHVVAVSGAIVTVAFDIQTPDTLPQVTLPILWPEYVRLPIQGGPNGTKGACVPFDAYLGPISGLGGSTATLLKPGNLGSLGFLPIGNKNWTTVDPNVVTIYGPNGVTIRDQASNTTFLLTATSVTITRGSSSIVLNNTGVTIHGDLTVTGNTSFGGGAKKVVLDGDPVIGGGGGTVQASSTTIKAT